VTCAALEAATEVPWADETAALVIWAALDAAVVAATTSVATELTPVPTAVADGCWVSLTLMAPE
jgi:hypothetical protein